MSPKEQSHPGLTSIACIFVGMMTIVGLTSSAHGANDPVFQELISLAQAEASLADANVAIIRQRVEALRSLQTIDNASWLEVKSAEIELQDAVETANAHRQLVGWLSLNQAAVAEHGSTASTIAEKPSLIINVSLPGSRAILGWVDVSQLEEPLRTQTLDLLSTRTAHASNRPAMLAAEENRIATLDEQIALLERVERKHAVEIDRLRLQRNAIVSTIVLINSQVRLQEIDNKTTLKTIAEIRSLTTPKVVGGQLTHASYDAHLFNVLSTEAASLGQVKIAETLQQWSIVNHDAQLSLTRNGLSSSFRLLQTRHELEDITQTLQSNQDLRQWRMDWIGNAADSIPKISSHPSTRGVNEILSTEVLRNPELLRQSVDLYREFALLQAQFKSLQLRTEMQRELSEHLNEQSTPNPGELQQAALLSKLLAHQLEFLQEQIEIVRLALESLPDLAIAQKDNPINLIHVNDEAVNLILFAAQRRRELSSQPQGYVMEQRLRKQSDRVKRLFDMGYASRKEVLDVEQHLLNAKGTFEKELANREAAEMNCQLLEAILTPSIPESAVTASTQSVLQ